MSINQGQIDAMTSQRNSTRELEERVKELEKKVEQLMKQIKTAHIPPRLRSRYA